ncbi:MAG: hypothetical protein IIX93_01165 [Clostridia bacterium]|nr:hypothetical protein [Clostridia bacterium]
MNKIKRGLYILLFLVLIALPVVTYPYLGAKVDGENFEKRTLAEKPALTIDNFTIFPAQYEAYFNDSLPFRNRMIAANNLIDHKMFRISSVSHVLVGSDGFLFYHPNGSDGNPIGDYMGTTVYSEQDIKLITHRLLRAQYDLEKQGRKFAVLIAPNKETMYAEEYLPGAKKVNEQSRADKLYAYLKNTDLHVTFPKAELRAVMEAHPDWYTYYKTATHWNSIGAYVGTSLVMEKLGLPINDIESVRVIEKQRAPGDLAYMLGMTETLPNDKDYNIVDESVPAAIRKDNSFGDGDTMVRYTNMSGNGKTLLVVRDSFAVFMMPYFNNHFSECYYVHRSAYHPGMIKEYDPDYVVYETVERYIEGAMNFYVK